MRTNRIAWALTLGFALAMLAGPVASAYDLDRTPVTQDSLTDAHRIGQIGTALLSDRRCDCDTDYVTIGLQVRWGYLDDPAVAGLEGRWRWNENHTSGSFLGMWHLLDRRVGGSLWGDFRIPSDGQGGFRGQWNVSGGREAGYLWGAWVREDRLLGHFDGMWNFSDGRDGGAVAGRWAALTEDGGGFVGHGIAAPSLRPVDWDGGLRVSAGAEQLLRTLRWESGDRSWDGEDHVRQVDRQTIVWQSTTTVNWDGLLFAIHVTKTDPAPRVALRTAQASFEWSARELIGLHLRQAVDRLGHEIEVRGFLIERHDDRDYARLAIGMRWGLLNTTGRDEPARNATEWDGGARISDGALVVRYTFSFERGDTLLPRDNRQTVRWESRTTTGWDGLLVVALIPLDHFENATFALKAGAFQHTFALQDLPGRHVFDVDGVHQVEVRAVRG
ncbi:MAG TPA: hypothetical protein VGR51_00640 [Thermoplasmata archaeon]|nr:hypothetical protein [Thermoplasmata archaeon]